MALSSWPAEYSISVPALSSPTVDMPIVDTRPRCAGNRFSATREPRSIGRFERGASAAPPGPNDAEEEAGEGEDAPPPSDPSSKPYSGRPSTSAGIDAPCADAASPFSIPPPTPPVRSRLCAACFERGVNATDSAGATTFMMEAITFMYADMPAIDDVGADPARVCFCCCCCEADADDEGVGECVRNGNGCESSSVSDTYRRGCACAKSCRGVCPNSRICISTAARLLSSSIASMSTAPS